MNVPHPAADLLRQYSVGQMSDESAGELERHLAECPQCEETLDNLAVSDETLISELRRPAVVDPVLEEPELREALANIVEHAAGVSEAAGGAGVSAEGREIGVYRLLEELGKGGMGTVYRALHTRLEKVVALKILATERLKDPQSVSRFDREMKAVGKLEHPHIVRAFDAGEADGQHFLVTEYVEGADLSQLSRKLGPLPIADACELARQAALGLEEANEHGMVHRDIKPANLFLARQKGRAPMVKVLDLGLALIAGEHAPTDELTGTGQIMGTIDYMAPEQAGDTHNVDIRADVYSLGATLYRLLTGSSIYRSDKQQSVMQKLTALATRPAPPIQSRRAEVPDELAAVVQRMLEKDPGARFATPADVAKALEPFCAGHELIALLQPADVERTIADAEAAANSASVHDGSVETQDAVDPGLQPTVISTADHVAGAETVVRPRSKSGRALLWVAGGVVGALLMFGAVVFVTTGEGKLKLTVNKEDISVKIDGKQIEIESPRDRLIVKSLPAGRHEVEVIKDGFTSYTREFRIFRNGEVELDAEFLPLITGAKTKTPDADVRPKAAGTKWQPGPKENVLRGLIPRPAVFDGVKRWQVETKLPRGMIRSVVFSPDGERLACASDLGSVRIFDANNLGLLEIIDGHTHAEGNLDWSRDGNWLAIPGDDERVRLWHTKKRTVAAIAFDLNVLNVSFSPDSRQFAAATRDRVEVRTIEGKRLFAMSAPQVKRVAYSPDGKWIASGGEDNTIRFWNAEDGTVGSVIKSKFHPRSLSWSPDSRQLAANDIPSNKFSIWNLDGSLSQELKGPNSSGLRAVAWSPGGDLLLSTSTTFKIHNLKNEEESIISGRDFGNLMDVSWHPDGRRFATVTERREIAIWRSDNTELVRVRGPKWIPRHVKWSHDGELLAMAHESEGKVVLWNVGGQWERSVKGNSPIAWHPDERQIAVAKLTGGVQIFGGDGKSVSQLHPTFPNLNSLAWSPDGSNLAVGTRETTKGTIEIWEVGGKRRTVFNDHERGPVFDIAWSPDGTLLASAGGDGKTRIWQPNGVPGAVMPSYSYSVAWNKTSELLATSRVTTMIWNREGQEVQKFPGVRGRDDSVGWSPDGERLVTGSADRSVRIWSSEGEEKAEMRQHASTVRTVDWSPTGQWIASGANDGTVMVWDAKRAEPVWVSVPLNMGEAATFSVAGEVIDGDAALLDEHFVYIVERDDGRRELLKPAEFETLVAEGRLEGTAKPQAGGWRPTESQRAFLDRVGKLPAVEQVEAVRAKLQEVNPGFDGEVTHKIDDGVVVEFSFVSDEVTEIWPVRGLAGLKALKCPANSPSVGKLADLSPVAGMPLVELVIRGAALRDLSPLRGMRLVRLICEGTNITDIAALAGMPLEQLSLSSTRVTDLRPLSGMPLRRLAIGGTPAVDLSPIRDLPLEKFECNNSDVADLTPLRGMPLKQLLIGASAVTDLSPLSGMGLEFLSADYLYVADFSVLRTIKSKGMKFGHATRLFDQQLADDVTCGVVSRVNNQTPSAYLKELKSRRTAAVAFAATVSDLPTGGQVEKVIAKLLELNRGYATESLQEVIENGAVTEITLESDGSLRDASPLMAFKKLKKVTLTEDLSWPDLSGLKHVPIEELNCPDAIAFQNSGVLMGIATLKTVNGKPAGEYWKALPGLMKGGEE